MGKFEANSELFNEDLRKFWPISAFPQQNRPKSDRLLAAGALPAKATDDALHIAVCAYHNVDYLLTWNCRHIDNAETKPMMRSVCALHGYTCPEICVPPELMGDTDER
uniref:PIN domain-containing protein n=1 Tax=Candidatus Kentrum sp. DK TaxID=2126562 RepID=A0A450RZX5_9GAMM|nr:MAG: hypothetical protein BECKDK2373C_GA0170839_100926 [Candidatus Kentron sp. DK]VFJ44887.1 MAG: hypothetical protein BECKDK2373B_GA0170837_100836 [Candidatus Kentron sp. DK]